MRQYHLSKVQSSCLLAIVLLLYGTAYLLARKNHLLIHRVTWESFPQKKFYHTIILGERGPEINKTISERFVVIHYNGIFTPLRLLEKAYWSLFFDEKRLL